MACSFLLRSKIMCTCNTILTTAVTVTATNLILAIPAMPFNNCEKYVIRIAQDIPATATRLLNVAIQIGTDTTLYPITRKCGHYLYADQIKTRRNYCLLTAADTQRFVLINGYVYGCNPGSVPTIPTPTTTTTVEEIEG